MVSEKALQEFKKIWKEEFGEEISDQKALDEATALLTFFDAIYRPIKKEWLDEREEKGTTMKPMEQPNITTEYDLMFSNGLVKKLLVTTRVILLRYYAETDIVAVLEAMEREGRYMHKTRISRGVGRARTSRRYPY